MAIRIHRLAAGFVIAAQLVLASKLPSGTDWVHEIKHDGYRIIVRRDLVEHHGEDLRGLPFLDRKAALVRLLRNSEPGILLNEHIVEDGPLVFAHACRLGAEGIASKRVDGTYLSGPCRVWIKVRNPASIAVKRERSETWNRPRQRVRVVRR
jgi:ATP-dependent DNA ligase